MMREKNYRLSQRNSACDIITEERGAIPYHQSIFCCYLTH